MAWFEPELESLLAVAAALLDESGTLIEANAGFLWLIKMEKVQPIGTHVEQFFIQPDFATLVCAQPDADGKIYHGLLTIGDYMGQTRTLRARVWRVAAQLRVLAEHDIGELERLNHTVLELNRDYANVQRTLAQTNLKLQRLNSELELHRDHLEELVAARTSELDRARCRRSRQPRQKHLPRQHEPRIAHPAECHPRLLQADAPRYPAAPRAA